MKDHSGGYHGCSAGIKCLLVSALDGTVLCLSSDTEPVGLTQPVSTVSAVQFKGNTLRSQLIPVTLSRLFFLHYKDLFSTLRQRVTAFLICFSLWHEKKWQSVGQTRLKERSSH